MTTQVNTIFIHTVVDELSRDFEESAIVSLLATLPKGQPSMALWEKKAKRIRSKKYGNDHQGDFNGAPLQYIDYILLVIEVPRAKL